MNQILDIKRLGYLARRDFLSGWRGIAVASGAVAGVMFLLVIIGTLFNGQNSMDYTSYLTNTLIIWGSISASMAFTSLHDKTRNETYLMLPASSVEKTLIRLLSVSVATLVYIIVMLSLASIFSEAVIAIVFHTKFSPLNPFQGMIFKTLGYVVILQSVFFLGAAWFKKAHFIKTVLTLILLSIAIGILSAVIFRLFFTSYFEGFFTPGVMHFDMSNLMESQFPSLMNTIQVIGKVFLYGLIAPFCWVIAWLRVKETQSSDGV